MIANSTLHAVSILIGLLVILYFLYGPYQALVTDLIRQRLFEIRDSIFDVAADKKLAFDHEAYVKSREWLNFAIQYAHTLTWPRLLFMWLFIRNRGQNEAIAFLKVFEKVQDPEVQKFLKRKLANSFIVVAALIWLRAPLLIVITSLVPFLLITLFISDSIRRAMVRIWEWFKQEMLCEVSARC